MEYCLQIFMSKLLLTEALCSIYEKLSPTFSPWALSFVGRSSSVYGQVQLCYFSEYYFGNEFTMKGEGDEYNLESCVSCASGSPDFLRAVAHTQWDLVPVRGERAVRTVTHPVALRPPSASEPTSLQYQRVGP